MDILCNNINCDGIGMRRSDWDNFRECEDIVLNGQVIWVGTPLSIAVRSQIYEDIVTTGHHSEALAAEVWRAANLYCKSHAASHPELTAQGKLLSAFVNADVNMYCSLPLALTTEAQSALPTRYALSNGNYALTGLFPTQDMEVESKWYFKTDAAPGWNNPSVYGCWNSDRGNADFSLRRFANASFAPSFPSLSSFMSFSFTPNKVSELKHTMNGFWLDGVQLYSGSHTLNVSNRKEFAIFYVNGNSQGPNRYSGCVMLNLKQGGIENIFVPCKENGTNYLLNLETLQKKSPNTGSFTIEKS